jgi:hypothetical protein
MHVLIRIIHRYVFYHRDVLPKFSANANGRLDARMRDESDHDQAMDAVPLELQIQICVGETARTPMFPGDNLT